MKPAQLIGLLLAFVACISASANANDDPGQRLNLQPPEATKPDLPFVLLIGDSIAQSYLPRARDLLVNEANVYFVLTPRGVFDGKALLQECYREREWDLVHLNYGLDALRHADADGQLANPPGGEQVVSLLEYNKTLSGMFNFFLGSARKRIWATTTPIPAGATGYVAGAAQQRNAQYETLIGARQFFINDLYSYVDIRRTDMLRPNSVEMTDAGSRLLGEVVAGRIIEVLNEGGDRNLPYVLILGDSISGGYNITVRELLMGKANVLWGGYPATTSQPERTIIDREQQMGCKIDIVHFNWGFHAMKFIDDENHLKTPETGHRFMELEDYGDNLETFVTAMGETDAELIWASTTPVNGSPWARDGDSVTYNATAAEVMQRHGVMINDLYTHAKEDQLHERYGDCHFNAESSAKLAIPIADSILRALQEQ